MNIQVSNDCVEAVYVVVDGEAYKVLPKQRQTIEITPIVKHELTVKCDSKSYCNDGFYYLYVAAQYCFDNLDEGCVFTINQKKADTEVNVYLLKPEIHLNGCECLCIGYSVTDKESVEKIFLKRRRRQIFFTDLFEYSMGELVIAMIIGIVIFYFSGWKTGLIYTFFSYWALVIWTYLTNKSISFIFKKAFKARDEKENLQKYFNDDFLFDCLNNQ